jgi:HK97 family phage major capsid protein
MNPRDAEASNTRCFAMIEQISKSLGKIEENLLSFRNQQNELAERLLLLEQRGGAPGPESRGGESLGQRVVRALDAGNARDLLAKTGRVSLEVEFKAAGDPTTTTNVGTTANMTGQAPGQVLGIAAVLQMRGGGASTLDYPRYTGVQGAAGVQAAEGDTKAAVTADFTLISQSAITVAGYAKASRQAVQDAPELQALIDGVLRRELYKALDVVLVDGSVAPAFTGYEALATAYTSLVYTPMVDAISEGVSTMQQAGFQPDAVVLTPADWLAIVTAKGTANDHYLSGNYLGALPQAMRGLKVALSSNVASGKALLIDSAFLDVLMPQTITVTVGLDGNDFTKNLATVLAEMRVTPAFRATGAARLITPKA